MVKTAAEIKKYKHDWYVKNIKTNPKYVARLRELTRIWRLSHPDAARRWKAANPERTKELYRKHGKKWRAKNPVAAKYYGQKNASRRTGRDFTLTLEEYTALTTNVPCAYCGLDSKTKTLGSKVMMRVGGIDRVDSRRGYVKDNVVPCCWICNEMKKDRDVKLFLLHIEQIYRTFKKGAEEKNTP
jgi:hypothetical protein